MTRWGVVARLRRPVGDDELLRMLRNVGINGSPRFPAATLHARCGWFLLHLRTDRQTVMCKSHRQVEARCLLNAAQAFKHSPAWNEVVGRRRSLNEWRHIAQSTLAVCPFGLCSLLKSSRRLHC